jgi:hypothetical protein
MKPPHSSRESGSGAGSSTRQHSGGLSYRQINDQLNLKVGQRYSLARIKQMRDSKTYM